MRTKVVYSFTCTICQGQNQVIQYHKTLSSSGTFTSLSQVKEYVKQCELCRLNWDDNMIWSKAYLPAVRITNYPRVHEDHVEFHHVHVRLISSNEPLLGCSPLPDWLHKKRCIYAVDDENDNLCVW